MTKTVLVTGATGFIAAHIVQQLLEKGYKVRGTVRDPQNAKSVDHLTSLPGADKNLELVKGNLNSEEGWLEACTGCEVVMHTASPYILQVNDPQKDLVDPAVNGVKFVFKAAKEAGCVKKVIQTSSVAAIADEFDDDTVYDESHWNDRSSLTRSPYYYSKTLAEKEAHAFVEREGKPFELAVINPFAVLGPSLRGDINQSVAFIERIMKGQDPALPPIRLGTCDVRDVAAAHVMAMEKDVTGRFLICEGVYSWKEVAMKLKEKYPFHPIATQVAPSPLVKIVTYFTQPAAERTFVFLSLNRQVRLDNSRSKEVLGLEYTEFGKTVEDTAADLVKNKHVPEMKERPKWFGLL
uniref:NAD-dependent epimerase/dehydratase domain-containing protein n=1 Tax=Chromera velia CCMP2878 TaxID=1169474 RepID=A0A0G4F564_9ALVE|mmetsp:Transcript_28948/g.56644  ORF Transcript_28948/g.56644 Transcript_28948/m.56644 type:complete len:351 (-) Transcript_28948:400-1452(-)|eukprot:Cvel_2733.t1-p1 / transcript=Cvel_2733.t1 / gene=Cvel_2733 / organism=Chromera_velia_CCMP2878 / gene_product=Cinnamoyl-CoA reductase 1, putative / transcript_product=Cinnamoyl-CoA reductase 1, putative / location=Cvel_scaffold109:65712-70028(-) / protein_length=350 / sequence_SO=supercontig / SO=protein_coding / is_pseudo=false